MAIQADGSGNREQEVQKVDQCLTRIYTRPSCSNHFSTQSVCTSWYSQTTRYMHICATDMAQGSLMQCGSCLYSCGCPAWHVSQHPKHNSQACMHKTITCNILLHVMKSKCLHCTSHVCCKTFRNTFVIWMRCCLLLCWIRQVQQCKHESLVQGWIGVVRLYLLAYIRQKSVMLHIVSLPDFLSYHMSLSAWLVRNSTPLPSVITVRILFSIRSFDHLQVQGLHVASTRPDQRPGDSKAKSRRRGRWRRLDRHLEGCRTDTWHWRWRWRRRWGTQACHDKQHQHCHRPCYQLHQAELHDVKCHWRSWGGRQERDVGQDSGNRFNLPCKEDPSCSWETQIGAIKQSIATNDPSFSAMGHHYYHCERWVVSLKRRLWVRVYVPAMHMVVLLPVKFCKALSDSMHALAFLVPAWSMGFWYWDKPLCAVMLFTVCSPLFGARNHNTCYSNRKMRDAMCCCNISTSMQSNLNSKMFSNGM